MRFDFTEDKRLMMADPTGASSSPDITAAEDQGIAASLAGKSATEQQAIIARYRALITERATATANANTAGTSGPEAQKAVQQRGATGQQQNSEDAARARIELIKQAEDTLVKLMGQSYQGLMNAEQSIEQMKSGFSGMLEMVGIIANKCGATDFGQGCLDLAKDLRPKLVSMHPDAEQAIRDLKTRVDIDPTVGAAIIANGQNSAAKAAERGQAKVAEAAREGVGTAGSIPQSTALDGHTAAAPKTSVRGITEDRLDKAMSPFMLGKTPALSTSESLSLHDRFKKIVENGGGQAGVADTPNELAAVSMAVRMTVKDQTAENGMLKTLDLATAAIASQSATAPVAVASAPSAPRPGASIGR